MMIIVVRGLGRIWAWLVLAVHLDLNDYANLFTECRKEGNWRKRVEFEKGAGKSVMYKEQKEPRNTR